MKDKYISQGVSIICDLHNIPNNKLNNGDYLESILIKACELSRTTILNIYRHKFNPAGYTISITLSESHLNIHTYVDLESLDGLGDIFIDFFACGNSQPEIGVAYIVNQLCEGNDGCIVDMRVFKRGLDSGIVNLSEICELMC